MFPKNFQLPASIFQRKLEHQLLKFNTPVMIGGTGLFLWVFHDFRRDGRDGAVQAMGEPLLVAVYAGYPLRL